ncbi:MAG TPA: phosphatidate cytidylyltransferase [Methylomirabilota bacterium]
MSRVLSGVALLVVAGGAIWLAPSSWLLGLAVLVAVLGAVEYGRLCRHLHAPVSVVLVVVLTAMACAAMAAPDTWVVPALMLTLVTAATPGVLGGRPQPGTLAAVAATAFAPIYLGLPLGSLASVHAVEGREAVVVLLLTVVASDTAQYYAGRALGRRKLAPTLSPKKTVEGAVGGVAGGTAAFLWLSGWWLPEWPWASRLLLGVLLVVAGIVGDLFESLFKRTAEVKDSSHLIPGHGGVLDRIDALLFAAPVYFVALRYGGAFAS